FLFCKHFFSANYYVTPRGRFFRAPPFVKTPKTRVSSRFRKANLGIRTPFFPCSQHRSPRDEGHVAQPLPYMALKDAPVPIRRAATVAQISISLTRSLGILFTTLIIATLPTWVPGLLTYQTYQSHSSSSQSAPSSSRAKAAG